jgi:hypothetical protein
LEALLFHFLDEEHDGENISKRLRHRDVFGFSGQQGDLGLKSRCPNDRTSCIENNPSAAGFQSTLIMTSKLLVPKSGEVGNAIAFESLGGI